MSAFEPDYSVTVWNETHHYRLADGKVCYRFGDSDATYSIDLDRGSYSLTPRWQRHRHFRTSFAVVAFPLITLGTIYAKSHTVAGLGAMLYMQAGIFIAGLLLLARYRERYRAFVLRTTGGDALLIYQDPARLDRSDAFIERVNSWGAKPVDHHQVRP